MRREPKPPAAGRCRLSGRTVTWIPRHDWAFESDRTVTCLCGAQAHFRVRLSDLPGCGKILAHDPADESYATK
jgi:hypothetical protein